MPTRRSKPARKASAKAVRKAAKRRAPKAARPRPAARRKAPRPARPAAARRPAEARHRCSALDPFGDPCQNLPRPGTDRCTIHTPNPAA